MITEQRETSQSHAWHGECKVARMPSIDSSHPVSFDSGEFIRRESILSRSFVRSAGREVVWLTIAGAFFLLETFVFITDLPVSKLFSRRAPDKTEVRSR